MKRLCLILLLAVGGRVSAQLVLPICSAQLPCPGFPLGSVQAGVDQNGWRHFKLTLTQNVTQFSFQGVPPPAQAVVNVIFTQDAIGGRTVTFASNISSPCTIATAANASTLCQFEYDGTAGLWFGSLANGLPPNVATGSVLASQGISSPPVYQAKATVDVRDFSGSDWCAQVNAADTAFVGAVATLLVPQQMAGLPACSTQINLTSNHKLEFGQGTYNLGTLNSRAGISIGHAVNGVSVVGLGIGRSILTFSSFNVGNSNIFPWGSAIGIGTVTTCSVAGDPNNNIYVAGITFADQQTGNEIGNASNPSIISGACVNEITIEYNEFTNAKGNSAVAIAGKFNTAGGLNYRNQFNKYDGTSAGNWGQLTADNSSNFTNVWWIGNNVSGYKCSAFGMGGIFRVLVSENIIDMTQVGTGTCSGIGVGANANVGYVGVTNNTIFVNSGNLGPCIQTIPGGSSADFQVDIENNRCIALGGAGGTSTVGIGINGVSSGTSPTQIIHNNYLNVAFPMIVNQGPLFGNVEISNNTIEGAGSGQGILNCTAPGPAIISGSTLRIFNNKVNSGTVLVNSCTDPTLVFPAFSSWGNTFGTTNAPTSISSTLQKSETGAADGNVLTFSPPTTAGTYRACVSISVSSATAGVIAWFLTWTDSSGNLQTNIAQDLFQDGTAAPATSFTTSAAGNYHMCRQLDINSSGSSIIIRWVGGGTTAAKMSATIERLI